MISTKRSEGRGFLLSGTEALYEGYWKNNKKHFRGRAIFDTGYFYIGEFKDDLQDGEGVEGWIGKDSF